MGLEQACKISIDPKGLEELPQYLAQLDKKYSGVALISDENVFPVFGDLIIKGLNQLHIRVETLLLPPGEETKSLITANYCWERLLNLGFDRKTLIIVLGGGALIDLGGFVASTYMRGVDLIIIPTTLLGMVDAAIGGKNGINLAKAKNMVGTMYHPKLVINDPSCLRTLPEREFRSGLAEIIKYGVIDADLFHYLEHNIESILQHQSEKIATIIGRSCEIKSRIVEQDSKGDTKIRNLLNYGHTFGHAIESATDYKKYTHGEAVSIGMSCAALLSHKMGFVDEKFIERQDNLCLKVGLPIHIPKEVSLESIMSFILKDKKHIGGKLCFVLPQRLGSLCQVDNVDKNKVIETLKEKQN